MVNLATIYGGDRGIRTPDLCDANAALSLLSYIPISTLNYSIYGYLLILLITQNVFLVTHHQYCYTERAI